MVTVTTFVTPVAVVGIPGEERVREAADVLGIIVLPIIAYISISKIP